MKFYVPLPGNDASPSKVLRLLRYISVKSLTCPLNGQKVFSFVTGTSAGIVGRRRTRWTTLSLNPAGGQHADWLNTVARFHLQQQEVSEDLQEVGKMVLVHAEASAKLEVAFSGQTKCTEPTPPPAKFSVCCSAEQVRSPLSLR